MSVTVWKFTCPSKDEFKLTMPKGAQILTFASQGLDMMIWALVDSEQVREGRHFRLVGTGHPIANSHTLHYIGTCHFTNPQLVFHLFEVKDI